MHSTINVQAMVFTDRPWNFAHGLLASFARARCRIDVVPITKKVALHSKPEPHSSATCDPKETIDLSHAAQNALNQL